MSSNISNEGFLIQTLTEKNKELQMLNNLLFNKIASLKLKIKELEAKQEFKNNSKIIELLDDFEIIDYTTDK